MGDRMSSFEREIHQQQSEIKSQQKEIHELSASIRELTSVIRETLMPKFDGLTKTVEDLTDRVYKIEIQRAKESTAREWLQSNWQLLAIILLVTFKPELMSFFN